MKRVDLLSHLIRTNNYRKYLEIGCNRDGTFTKLPVTYAIGVDPNRGGTHRMTSDEFFCQNNEFFDLVFIDGLHRHHQVLKDVTNSVQWLNPGGCIVLHDCLPTKREHQLEKAYSKNMPWTGDVWKAIVELRQCPEFDVAVLDSDWGLGVLFVRPNSNLLTCQLELSWDNFIFYRNQWLRVVDETKMLAFVDGELEDIYSLSTNKYSLENNLTIETNNSTQFNIINSIHKEKLLIVFAHSNIGQFKHLHTYLNASGLSESYLLCSEAIFNKYKDTIPNLIAFIPHGNKLKTPNSFYYLSKNEESCRRSLGIRNVIKNQFVPEKIDIFIGHGSAGNPSMLFDDVPFPIVTYLEFPSFKSHGWDSRFPPEEEKQLRDKNYEMQNFYLALKSDRVIVPSIYARKMFPRELQPNITVIKEGFPINENDWNQGGGFQKEQGKQYIGFTARDLSSAKGFDQFIRIANIIAVKNPNIQFVIIGSPDLLYSYEKDFLLKQIRNSDITFRDWVIENEKADRSRFIIIDKVNYEDYSKIINDIDLFLYPLQFGSSNWGLFEILSRGKIVIASNQCFIPEVITHGINGFMCNYNDLDEWVHFSLTILDNPDQFLDIGKNAREISMRHYSIQQTTEDFLQLCREIRRFN